MDPISFFRFRHISLYFIILTLSLIAHFTGQHYWYDVSKKMDCQDFFPVFLLYNDGLLNGFGWATSGNLESKYVEHPPADRLHVSISISTTSLRCHTHVNLPKRAMQEIRSASRMKAGQGLWIRRQDIFGHFRPLWGFFGANGLLKDTFLFEGRGCIPPPPPRYAPLKLVPLE